MRLCFKHALIMSADIRHAGLGMFVAEEDENAMVGLAAARRRLLKTSADAWSDETASGTVELLQDQPRESDRLLRGLDVTALTCILQQSDHGGLENPEVGGVLLLDG